ncbi:MAG: C4-dicarboxylate ABC transporter permease, partial [Alphaproteobacteria bacterium HGW-Alphaproteobacteria-2]
FIVCAVSGQKLTDVSRQALPLVAICLVVLALVALAPAISLALPQAMLPVR